MRGSLQDSIGVSAMSNDHLVNRRGFVKAASGAVAAASLLAADPLFGQTASSRRRYAIVGTGDRATGMWGRPIRERYSDIVEFVGLCDINPKRVEASKALMSVDCPRSEERRVGKEWRARWWPDK